MLKTSFTSRIILTISLVVLLQSLLIGGYALIHLTSSLEEQVGQRALNLARALAQVPDIKRGITERDTESLQKLTKSILEVSQARFIVIGDHNAIRLAHPIPERIGLPMQGGDSQRALIHKESYVSIAEGSLGRSMRGKTPVLDKDGEVIGIISVGYMLNQVKEVSSQYRNDMLALLSATLCVSIIAAVAIGHHFKHAIFGLEPEEIRQLYDERQATLASIHEGIIAINDKGIITTFNHAALEILELDKHASVLGENIQVLLPESKIMEVAESGKSQFDQEAVLNGQHIIVNRVPLRHEGRVCGVVSSFRHKDEITAMSQSLTRIKDYAETLRSQAHEHSNKLHTIAGLIQIGANEKALALIGQETQSHQALLTTLVRAVPHAVLAGCILGKYNRAHELGLELSLDPDSCMKDIPPHIRSESLITILGNLLDNAFDATLENQGKQIHLSMTDLGSDLVFEVEDQGKGISEAHIHKIFEHGYSSKAQERGVGLALVKQTIDMLGGDIIVSHGELGGACMSVYLPKSGE